MDIVANNRAQCKCRCFHTNTHTHSKMSTRHLDVPISCYSTSYRVEFTASLKVQSCYADYEMSPELLDKVVRGERGDISILARASLKASYTNTPTACWHRQAAPSVLLGFRREERGKFGGIFPPLSSLSGLHSFFFFFIPAPKKDGEKNFQLRLREKSIPPLEPSQVSELGSGYSQGAPLKRGIWN